MLQRVHIQILDSPAYWAEEPQQMVENQLLAEQLDSELRYHYPSVVSVEYIDLFSSDEDSFPEVRQMLHQGVITTPVVLINGVPRMHGGIPTGLIKTEVERIISSGPLH